MKNQFKGILAVLLLVIFSSPGFNAVSGEIYKWKDKDGNIIFSDTPPPPGVDVEVKEFKENTTERPKVKENINLPRPQTESFREKRPYSDVRVTMYSTSWCPYCVKAKNYLLVMPQLRLEILFSGSGWSLQRKLEAVPFRDVQRGGYL